jgi:diguanylate cyclase (GGDEF)-like protein
MSFMTARGATALGLACVALIALADYWTGAEAAFTLLYLGPIAFVGWQAGRRAGLVIALVCAASWLVADLATRPVLRHPALTAWNLLVETGVFVTFALLLSRLQDRLALEAALARADPLTGLANRRAFFESAGLELERARRYAQPITVACLDLDGFKAVNDRLGHGEGDELLRTVAQALRHAIRPFDLAARLGGDEFALLVSALDVDEARVLLERIRTAVGEAMGARWPVTVSVGAITLAAPPAELEAVLAEADRLMYEVKREGKGAIRHVVV